jgi:tricorn protease-like protein
MERSKVLNTKVTFTIRLHVEDIYDTFFTYTYEHDAIHDFLVKEMKKLYDFPDWYYDNIIFNEIKKVSQEEIDIWHGENI